MAEVAHLDDPAYMSSRHGIFLCKDIVVGVSRFFDWKSWDFQTVCISVKAMELGNKVLFFSYYF